MKKRRRIPEIDPSLVILMTLLQVWRDVEGMRVCHELLIGPARRMLGPIAEDPASFRGDRVEVIRDQARQSLAGMCRVCPFKRCPMRSWGMA